MKNVLTRRRELEHIAHVASFAVVTQAVEMVNAGHLF